MENVAYVLSARQDHLFKTQERIADHVANVNTLGYKAGRNVFSELITPKKNGTDKTSFSNISQVHRDFSQGIMQKTDRALDVAINGNGFFRLETPLGPRYTRAGDFVVNGNGTLVSKNGYTVTGPGGGSVSFAPQDTEIQIKEDGTVYADGQIRGRIGVFTFNTPQQLERAGNGLFIARTEEPKVALIEQTKVAQGMLEGSNVSSIKEMSSLIEVSRGIEQTTNLLKNYQDSQLSMIRQLSQSN